MYEVTLKEIINTGLDVETTYNGGVKMWNPETEKNPIYFHLNSSFSVLSATDYKGEGIARNRCLCNEGDLSRFIQEIVVRYNVECEINSFEFKQKTAKREFKNSYFLGQVENAIARNGLWDSSWSKTHSTCKVYRQGQGYPKVVLDTATQELAIFRTAKEEVFEGKILDLHFLDRVFKSVTL